jgi:hypothetical protein
MNHLPDSQEDSFSNVSVADTNGNLKKNKKVVKKKKNEIFVAHSGNVSSDTPTYEAFKELWNTYAKRNGWTSIRIMGQDLKDRLRKASKELTTMNMWETALKGLEADPFFGGSSSDYKATPLTLFYKNRYMDFYNKGADESVTGVDAILDSWSSKLAASEPHIIPTLDLPLNLPEDK